MEINELLTETLENTKTQIDIIPDIENKFITSLRLGMNTDVDTLKRIERESSISFVEDLRIMFTNFYTHLQTLSEIKQKFQNNKMTIDSTLAGTSVEGQRTNLNKEQGKYPFIRKYKDYLVDRYNKEANNFVKKNKLDETTSKSSDEQEIKQLAIASLYKREKELKERNSKLIDVLKQIEVQLDKNPNYDKDKIIELIRRSTNE